MNWHGLRLSLDAPFPLCISYLWGLVSFRLVPVSLNIRGCQLVPHRSVFLKKPLHLTNKMNCLHLNKILNQTGNHLNITWKMLSLLWVIIPGKDYTLLILAGIRVFSPAPSSPHPKPVTQMALTFPASRKTHSTQGGETY